MQMFFYAIWFILLKERTIIRIKTQLSRLQNLACSEDCSLCSRRSSFITSDPIVPPRPSPCCPCLCWASTAYLSPFLAAWACSQSSPPHWQHFPQIPGNCPPPCRAQLALRGVGNYFHIKCLLRAKFGSGSNIIFLPLFKRTLRKSGKCVDQQKERNCTPRFEKLFVNSKAFGVMRLKTYQFNIILKNS